MRDLNEHITRLMLGLGFDGADGEIRVTKGPNFRLLGGSRPTHERMQETCMRFNEELRRRGTARTCRIQSPTDWFTPAKSSWWNRQPIPLAMSR